MSNNNSGGAEMQLSTMNKAQMKVLESFASVKSDDELDGLMDVLKNYYASLLDKELERLWDNGTLDQKRLDELRNVHLRTPYRDL